MTDNTNNEETSLLFGRAMRDKFILLAAAVLVAAAMIGIGVGNIHLAAYCTFYSSICST